MTTSRSRLGAAAAAVCIFLNTASFALSDDEATKLYNGKTREEVFDALRAGHDAIMKNTTFSSEGSAASSNLSGLPNDATQNPNDATLTPNNANLHPNDAAARPNDATAHPNNALLNPNDATRSPNTTSAP